MRFRLIIDPHRDEEVVVIARRPNALTVAIEELVCADAGGDQVPGFAEDEMRMLKFADIQYIFTEDGRTMAVVEKNEVYRLKQRLYELEEMLPGYFIRISKSALANERHLVRFTTGFSGAVDAVFRCGRKEGVSRRCFAEIKRRFNER